MSISISGSSLQQSLPHHIHRKHAGAAKGVAEESSTSPLETDASETTSGGTVSSALTSFLAQLSSLDRQSGVDGASPTAAANGTAANPNADTATSPIEQLMQTLQAFAANTSPV